MRRMILVLACSTAIGAAQGADLPVYDTVPFAPVAEPAGYNWNSYFVGASGLISSNDPIALGADVFLGVTATAGDFLYGGVLSAGVLSGDDDATFHVELASRFGAVLTDNIAAYGIIGGGHETEFDAGYATIGAGMSVATSDNMTIEASLKGNFLTGAPSDDRWRVVGGVGVAFHF